MITKENVLKLFNSCKEFDNVSYQTNRTVNLAINQINKMSPEKWETEAPKYKEQAAKEISLALVYDYTEKNNPSLCNTYTQKAFDLWQEGIITKNQYKDVKDRLIFGF